MSDSDLMEGMKIEGNDAEVDSFAACVTAIMKRWARDFDYSFVAGLTGCVFSPVINESESCSAWWTEFGNDNGVELLGKALGFNYRQSPDITREEFEKEGKLSPILERFWISARDARKQGRMVIIGTWPCWSLVTGWSDDLFQPEVVCLANLKDVCKPNPWDKIYILTEAPARMTRGQAIREALKSGADIADGASTRPGFKYGGALYGEIVDRLDSGSFCPDCKDAEWSCMVRTMTKIQGLGLTAAEFLRFAGEFLGKQISQTDIESSAKAYAAIAEMSLPYTKKSNVEPNWGDKVFLSHLRKDVEAMESKHVEASKHLRAIAGAL